MSFIRQIQTRRTESVQMASQTRIRRPNAADGFAPFSFRCRVSGEICLVYKGYFQRIGAAPVLIATDANADGEMELAFEAGSSIFAVFTYRADYNTPGVFDSSIAVGAPPADDSTRRVTIIADMIDVDGIHTVVQRHFGDVVVLDLINRGNCS